MTDLERYRDALQRIVDYDASLRRGYLDEWEEAAAFVAVQEIAQDALVPGTIAARKAHERSVENAHRQHAKQLRKEASAGKRHFAYHGLALNKRTGALEVSGAWVCVLNQKHDERADLVYVKVERVVGAPPSSIYYFGAKFTINISNLYASIEEIPK